MKIAIVEDEKFASELLEKHLQKWKQETSRELECDIFSNALDFLDTFKGEYDIIFMDIEMPHFNGMEAAEKLRKKDPLVLLVFVTNMQQYALQGYAVNALDFIVKPVGYYSISTLMDKAVRILEGREMKSVMIKIAGGGGLRKIAVTSLLYVESWRHKLLYHTIEEDIIESWGALTDVERVLPEGNFARCNVGVLVNLRHVKAIEGEEIVLGNERLKLSRLRKKEFFSAIAKYMGNGI